MNDIDLIEKPKMNIYDAIRWLSHLKADMGDPCYGELWHYSQALSDIMAMLGCIDLFSYWIPLKTRPMDEEEITEWSERIGYNLDGDEAVIYVSQLPDDGQEVLVCTKWGQISIDTFGDDPDYGCGFEDHDIDDILAWMPLPEPYKEEE